MLLDTLGFVITLDMRKYLLFIFILLLLGCTNAQPTPEVQTVSPIQIRTVSWDHAVGEFRLAFALLDGPDAAQGITAVSLKLSPIDDGETAVWEGNATPFDSYEIPYWIANPTAPEAGFWGVSANITQADGSIVQTEFVIEVVSKSGSPELGSIPPASQNKTVATEPSLENLSSGTDPNPTYYQLTVADALTNGKPTVVGFLTPGLCQTRWCAPVLGSVESIRQETGDAVNYIHIEVFDDFKELTYVPEMAEWGLDTREPWVFVLNAEGQITAKFSGPLSPEELGAAVRPLINP